MPPHDLFISSGLPDKKGSGCNPCVLFRATKHQSLVTKHPGCGVDCHCAFTHGLCRCSGRSAGFIGDRLAIAGVAAAKGVYVVQAECAVK